MLLLEINFILSYLYCQALRVSMEEQRARQEEDAIKPTGTVDTATSAPHVEGNILQGALSLHLRNISR